MSAIDLGSIQMPLTAATKTFAILAQRGAGKSYTAGKLAEEFHRVGIPFVVFDPIDVWWGLRLAADGVSPGLPVVVFGLEHADIALTPEMGEAIAYEVVENNVSCVISTFGLSKTAQRKLITAFSEELLKINRTPRHIIIEEAHEFVPQRVMGDMARCFSAVNSLIVMGRNRGLGATLISQRAATINKDSLTQIDTLLAFRNTSPQDRKALREWVEYHAAAGDFNAFMDSLPSLPTGEGWIWSPQFLNVFERIKIGPRTTFHPDREKLGAGVAMPKLAQGDVQAFIDLFHQHTEYLPEPTAGAKPVVSVVKETAILPAAKVPDWAAEKRQLIAAHEAQLAAKEQEIDLLKEEVLALRGKLEAIAGIVEVESFVMHRRGDLPAQPAKVEQRLAPRVNQEMVNLWAKKLGGEKNGAARILVFLADRYPMTFTRSQLALAIGMTAGGGSYQGYVATLLRNKMIVNEGDYLKLSKDLIQS